jgi:hypothetical protein
VTCVVKSQFGLVRNCLFLNVHQVTCPHTSFIVDDLTFSDEIHETYINSFFQNILSMMCGRIGFLHIRLMYDRPNVRGVI